MQSMLSESEGGSYFDPTRQYQWALRSVFETKSVPHLICMSQHTLSRVQGPIRSEIMIVAAMAAVRFKKKCFQDQSVFPVSFPDFSNLVITDSNSIDIFRFCYFQ